MTITAPSEARAGHPWCAVLDREFPARRVDVGEGAAISVREAGPSDAPCVVLLHGIGSGSASWLPVVRLLAREGCQVGVASRGVERAEAVCASVAATVEGARLTPVSAAGDASGQPHGELLDLLANAGVIVAAGAAGARLLGSEGLRACRQARVFVDLNAVPPEGIEGILAADAGRLLTAELPHAEPPAVGYGPLGVGGIKMKIHREAVRQIFASKANANQKAQGRCRSPCPAP